MVPVLWESRFEGENHEFCFAQSKFEVPLIHPKGGSAGGSGRTLGLETAMWHQHAGGM